jgi:hypothetical protein
VKHRWTWRGTCVAVAGATLVLAPLGTAGARTHHHSTTVKGSNPNSAMCQDVKKEQSGSTAVGSQFEKAMQSGNFAAAKQALLNAYDADMANVQKALAVIRTAPANVQAAFRNLLQFVQQVRTDIQNASSLQGLVTSFEGLGKNPQLQTDGATIANWYASVCGGALVPTTTNSAP